MDIRANLVYRYDVTCYFRSAFIKVKKQTADNYAPPSALGRIFVLQHIAWCDQWVAFLLGIEENWEAVGVEFNVLWS